jgi:hypothetical protein
MSNQEPTGYPVPQPAWGEYAPSGTPAPQPYGGPAWQYPTPPTPPARPRRIWDIVLTSILLVMGLIGTLIACFYAANLGQLVSIATAQRGLTSNGSSMTVESLAMVISHVVLLLAAAGISIPLLVRGRLVVFWIPLTAGAIAAIVFWVLLFIAIGSSVSITELQRIGSGS